MLNIYSGKKALEQLLNNNNKKQEKKKQKTKPSVHRIIKLPGGVENPADGARWGPETAACAPQARKVLGSTKWTQAKARCRAALLVLDLRSLRCWPVGTHRAITQATRLTVNHAEAVPQPRHTQGGCHCEYRRKQL